MCGPKVAQLLCLMGLTCFLPWGANAQDQCGDILQAGLFDQSTRRSEQTYANAERYWACNASLEDARDYIQQQSTRANSGGGSVSYGIFAAEGGGSNQHASSFTEEHLRTWKRNNCSDTSSEQNQTAFEFFAQSTVAAGVVAAWKECMLEREDFSCWASPHGNNVVFNINWRNSDTELPKVRSSSVSIGEQTSTLLSPGETVFIGGDSYVISRQKDQDVLIRVNLIHRDRFSYPCSVFVPALKDIPVQVIRQEPQQESVRQEPQRKPVESSSYPERPITFVVPWAAGGASDTAARELARSMSRVLGEDILVKNATGENGAVGARLVTGADADGYTILVTMRDIAAPNLRPLGRGLYVRSQTPADVVAKLSDALGRS